MKIAVDEYCNNCDCPTFYIPLIDTFPPAVGTVTRPAGVPLPGGLGAAVLLLLPEPGSPVLPGRRHRRAVQQRAGQPAAPHLRGQRQEPYRDGAQAGVHRGHAVPPSDLS